MLMFNALSKDYRVNLQPPEFFRRISFHLSQTVYDAAAYSSIEEFVSSEEVQSQLEAMQTEEMGVAVTGEGNKLIYTYTFAEGIATDGMAEVLEAGIQSQASTFQAIAATIALAVDVEDPVVVVRYQDSTGAEIYSAEFSAAE